MSKISVLLPTRKRFDLLNKCISSLIESAKNFKDNVEILLAMDIDDSETISKVCLKYKDFNNIKIVITPRYGYKYMHKYVNLLCSVSSGDWLFLFNDDATMESKDWDLEVLKYNGNFCIVNPSVSNGTFGGMPFPIIPKEWFDIVGHFSLNCSCDTWIQDISKLLANEKLLGLNIDEYTENIITHHDRCEETGNNNDSTYQERVYDDNVFYSNESMILRVEDANKLRYYLKETYGV